MRARMNYLRAITSQISDMEHKLETNALLRKIVEAAHDRNTKKTAKRCREFVERSAEFAIKILSEKEA